MSKKLIPLSWKKKKKRKPLNFPPKINFTATNELQTPSLRRSPPFVAPRSVTGTRARDQATPRSRRRSAWVDSIGRKPGEIDETVSHTLDVIYFFFSREIRGNPRRRRRLYVVNWKTLVYTNVYMYTRIRSRKSHDTGNPGEDILSREKSFSKILVSRARRYFFFQQN